MKPNASVFDSAIYADIFSSQPMREIWSDGTRIQRYLDFERALANIYCSKGEHCGKATFYLIEDN